MRVGKSPELHQGAGDAPAHKPIARAFQGGEERRHRTVVPQKTDGLCGLTPNLGGP